MLRVREKSDAGSCSEGSIAMVLMRAKLRDELQPGGKTEYQQKGIRGSKASNGLIRIRHGSTM